MTTQTSTPSVAEPQSPTAPLLDIADLSVTFKLDEGTIRPLDGVSFSIQPRQIVGLIGESGCGKSVTAQAILRILPTTATIVSGSIRLESGNDEQTDLVQLNNRGAAIRQIRGGQICMIFQEPMTAFSPVHTIGNQIIEAVRLHRTSNKREAKKIAIQILDRVGIPKPDTRLNAYPFQLSGGMRQRAMIAMALSTNPRLLIADEPTTALDVTIQAQILTLMKDLRDEFDMAILLITHDLGVVAETCEQVNVMYMGKIVETAPVSRIFQNPQHPYTQALLGSMPRLTGPLQDKLTVIKGTVPDPFTQLPGCTFHPRCGDVIAGTCDVNPAPPMIQIESGHCAACHLHAPK